MTKKILVSLVMFLCCANAAFAQQADSVQFITENARVPMRDKAALATTVLIPQNGGKSFPVIFLRTPYGRAYECKKRKHYTAKGYVVVVQDCRGTGESEGKFEPYLHEKEDGYDALDWISRQSWCNGNVGMIGASYEGQVQWLAAAGGHPVLKTIIPQVSGTDPFLDVPYDHGILKLSMIDWAYKMTYPDREVNDYVFDKLYTLPVSKIDDAFYGADVPLWDSWTKMDRPEDWAAARFLDAMRNVNIPVLYVSGNWDVEALSTQINWQRMLACHKKDQHLLFGPWEHNGFLEELPTKFSGVEYGPESKLDFEATWLRWFDHWLKGIDNGVEKEKPVKFFVTGLNEWISLKSWPDASFRKREYCFDFSAQSNGYYGLASKSSSGKTAGYTYSPEKVKLNMDPEFSESAVYTRDLTAGDHLALLTAPFAKTEILGGPACLDLRFSIDQADADFFVLLAEVDSAGQITVLGHPGKMRAMFRDNKSQQPVKAGEFYTARIDLFPFAHQFKKGSRLAVIIRSDWFPRYVRNTGSGEPLNSAATAREVKITIAPESRLILNSVTLNRAK